MTDERIKISVSDDKMAVLLNCQAADLADDLVAAEVESGLAAMKISGLLKREELRERIRGARNSEGAIKDMILARGTPAEAASGGKIQWARDFFDAQWAVIDEATDRVDYRERAVSGAVKKGEIVAIIPPVSPGKEGVDVFGHRIIPAKPQQSHYRLGSGLTHDEKTGSVVAEIDGMIRLQHNTVVVGEMCEVEEVGLESGNIHFPGSVVVRTDVDDLAVVEAGGTVEVGGVVWDARIVAGGDVIIRRGVSARGKGSIVSGGTVSAAHILNADITAEGGVAARKEIVQSRIRSRGQVKVEGGRIVGGEVAALGGIVVGEAGSHGNVTTVLSVGEDYRLNEMLREKHVELNKLREIDGRVHASIDPMVAQMGALPPNQRDAVAELMAQVSLIEERINALRQEIENMMEESRKRGVHHMRVLRALHPGVVLRILGVSRTVTQYVKGPLTITLDADKNAIMI